MSRESMAVAADAYYKTTPGYGYAFVIGDRVQGVALDWDRAGVKGTVTDIRTHRGEHRFIVRWDDGKGEQYHGGHYCESLRAVKA
jgi:hypothetical protein